MSSLVVEVSDSSLRYDRGRKLTLYAGAGVPEVSIINIPGGAVEVYREPKDEVYTSRRRRTDGMLSPVLADSVTMNVAAFLMMASWCSLSLGRFSEAFSARTWPTRASSGRLYQP